ncbi:MAG: hypothetical protein ABL878_13060 [Burkholderiales bacterium]
MDKRERPTRLSIVGRSKFQFSHHVLPTLQDIPRLSVLIKRIEAGPELVFSSSVQSVDDIKDLIRHIESMGIPKEDIRTRYPSASPDRQLKLQLSMGLEQSRLSFGGDVAEHDPDLVRYFIATKSFAAIKNGQRHLVVGPKGSGKSAILKEIAKDLDECLVITPEHYATDVLESLAKSSSNEELNAYVTTWKYTLLVEIFRRLVQTNPGAPGVSDLRGYLVSHGHTGADLSLFERFSAYLRRITKLRGKIGPTEAEIGLEGELESLFRMDELLVLVPSLRRALRRKPFTVFVDELDQSWNNSETANNFLVALLTAAIQLRGIDSQLHVIVFLRSEIFDLLKPTIAQLDKIRSDIEDIRWSSRELSNLIVTRAFYSLEIDPEDISAEAALDVLFPAGSSLSTRSFDYILSRTSYRPREVIQFCNLALSLAVRREMSSIDGETVLRAEEEFSVWKMEYIVAENMFIFPALDFLLEKFRGASRTLPFNAMDGILSDIILAFDREKSAPAWLKGDIEPTWLLDKLYQLEVIGVEKPNEVMRGESPWDAYDFVFSRPKARAEQSSSFMFHPGLWRALELN